MGLAPSLLFKHAPNPSYFSSSILYDLKTWVFRVSMEDKIEPCLTILWGACIWCTCVSRGPFHLQEGDFWVQQQHHHHHHHHPILLRTL